MLSNFEMAFKEMPTNFKSVNWDAFPNGYSDLIKKEEIWPHMLRNALTIGCNDALIPIDDKVISLLIVVLIRCLQQQPWGSYRMLSKLPLRYLLLP